MFFPKRFRIPLMASPPRVQTANQPIAITPICIRSSGMFKQWQTQPGKNRKNAWESSSPSLTIIEWPSQSPFCEPSVAFHSKSTLGLQIHNKSSNLPYSPPG